MTAASVWASNQVLVYGSSPLIMRVVFRRSRGSNEIKGQADLKQYEKRHSPLCVIDVPACLTQ